MILPSTNPKGLLVSRIDRNPYQIFGLDKFSRNEMVNGVG